MNNNYNFIKTDSNETAEHLRSQGFQEIKKQGQYYVFINKTGKLLNFDESHVTYTNILNV